MISPSYSCIGQPATFINAAIYQEVGPLDVTLNLVLDWDLWIRFGLLERRFCSLSTGQGTGDGRDARAFNLPTL